MDDSGAKPSLADDPRFLASLSVLDDGLANNAARGKRSAGPVPATPPPVGGPDAIPSFAIERAPAPSAARPPQVARPPKIARPAVPQLPAPARVVPEYESFYSLDDSPFGASEASFFYPGASHETAVEALVAAIAKQEPIIVVTGERRVGKSMLCRYVLQQLDKRTVTCYIPDPPTTADDVLRAALVQFGVVSKQEIARGALSGASRDQLLSTLSNFVGSLGGLQASAVVFIDDAERLPQDVLEGLNTIIDHERMPSFVLVGDPSLVTALRRPELDRLVARVATRIRLNRLSPDEVPAYVMHRMGAAGGRTRVDFDESAFTAIYDLSQGIPGIINTLCDGALRVGCERSASVIDGSLVNQVGRGLDNELKEEMPTPQLSTGLVAFVFIVMMCVGGAAAAWVLSDRLMGALAANIGVPIPPRSVSLPIASPIDPVSPPVSLPE